MALGNTPNHMNRAAIGILLQHENARSLRKPRIVLHDDCRGNAVNYVTDEYIIGGKLVIAVRRNSNVSMTCKRLHLF